MSNPNDSFCMTDETDGEFKTVVTPQKTAEDYLKAPQYTDEQMVQIAQAMQLELAVEAKNNLDFTRASSVMAMTSALKHISDSAQANIKNKIDAGNQGSIDGAAALLAKVLRQMGDKESIANFQQEVTPDTKAPSLDLDDESLELVDGETFVGIETLREQDFLTSRKDEEN